MLKSVHHESQLKRNTFFNEVIDFSLFNLVKFWLSS